MSDSKAEINPKNKVVLVGGSWVITPNNAHFLHPNYDKKKCQLGISITANPNKTSVLRFRLEPTGNAYLDVVRNEWYHLFLNLKEYLKVKAEIEAETRAKIEAENLIVVNRESSKEETNNFSSCINLVARDRNYVELSKPTQEIQSKLIHREKKMKRYTKVTSRNNSWQNFQESEEPISIGKKFLCGKCSYCEKNDDWNHLYINECSDDDWDDDYYYDKYDDWDDDY
jgi:hypothetical protein